MKNSLLKRFFVLFTIISVSYPSILMAETSEKNFQLETINWKINKSDCDSWYDYSTNQDFSVAGWTAISPSIRLYGYGATNKSCKGTLEISNDSLGMYTLFIYEANKQSWEKLAITSRNISKLITNQPTTLLLAKANISADKKNYADFSIKNSYFIESGNAIVPTTTDEVIASINIAANNGTSTISWLNPLNNNYRLSLIENEKLKPLSLKIDNRKKIATTDIPQNYSTSTVLVIKNNQKDVGLATWYAYKKCDCAASRDYPKGTKLKVTNLFPGSNYGKSVIVRVNDYGPMEYTGNLIDLDKVAFSKIANLGSGVVPVSVEVVK